MNDLLIEIGCEELPAGSAVAMAKHLADSLHTKLNAAGLVEGRSQHFGTPRRLAAVLTDVIAKQEDQYVERKGPAVAAAYKDGEPTKALLGFLKGAGATLDEITTVETPKGEWVVVKQTKPGKSLTSVVGEAMQEVIKTMPVPRRMRWSDQTHEFLRPVVWLTAVHGSEVLPIEVLGLKAGNTTLGHRFHAPQPIMLAKASDYVSALEAAYVKADITARRASVVDQVQRIAQQLGGTAVMDDDLVDEVTSLVEWPVALAGRFESMYLEIPKEALIQTMQENQRYFALLDDSGELMPAFITVANIESNNPETVIDGNERVIRPRFADTKFFWDQDKLRKLEDNKSALLDVLFQKQLGSVADKTNRMSSFVPVLASVLGADAAESSTAIALCKCDLTTEIVKELAKMQGIAGRYYALRDGHSKAIATAMELGVLRMLIEHERNIDMATLIDNSIQSFQGALGDIDRSAILEYINDRLRSYAQDQGVSADVVEAVLAKGITHPLDAMARMRAITNFRQEPAAASLSAASKRIGNLLKKQGVDEKLPVVESLLTEPAEKALFESLQATTSGVRPQLDNRRYTEALAAMSSLRGPVDTFFDDVMVMVDDAAVRANRLGLLQQTNNLCSDVADLSQLQIKG